ncbi:MAG: hypothetical protein WD226_08315 [Planctomycetota bacterium]
MRLFVLLLACLFLVVGSAFADILVHKDGRRIEGQVVRRTASEVVFKTKFATLTFPVKDVLEIVEQKTREQEHAERLAAAQTAEDFYRLALWCEEHKFRRRTREYHERALELDPDHAGANVALGRVQYKGVWMTPAERDARQLAEQEAEMRERGLVQYEGRWVTPEERAKLERGLVEHQGRWVTLAEAMRLKGLVEFEGGWIPAVEGYARRDLAAMSKLAGIELGVAFGTDVMVAGDADVPALEAIAQRADRARRWFGEKWSVEPGLELFGGRLAELYAFVDDALYDRTIAHTVERSRWIPEGWGAAVAKRYGYTWVDPVRLSGATLRNRPDSHLDGTCFHNFGHLMAISIGYDGRNLPAWYEEGVACLIESVAHGQNTVFCRATSATGLGSSSGSKHRPVFDDKAMRDDGWRARLAAELAQGGIEPFDALARREFHELALIDIATSRAILEWLLSREPGALAKFHAVLRHHAPAQPARVILAGRDRHACYDAAFGAAVGMNHRRADAEWRRWFRAEGLAGGAATER